MKNSINGSVGGFVVDFISLDLRYLSSTDAAVGCGVEFREIRFRRPYVFECVFADDERCVSLVAGEHGGI